MADRPRPRPALADLHQDMTAMARQLIDNPDRPHMSRRRPEHRLGDVFPIDAYGKGSKYGDKVLGSDIDALGEGNVGLVLANIYTDPTDNFAELYPWHAGYQQANLEARPDIVVPVTTGSQLRRVLEAPERRTAVIQSVEGIYGPDSEDSLMRWLDRMRLDGVRSIHLVHNPDSAIGTGHPTKETTGLTDLGKKAARKVLEDGMFVDFSHASAATVTDILDIHEQIDGAAPPIASHTGSREKLGGKTRGISDAHAIEVARRDGLIGVMPARWIVETAEREDQATIESVGGMVDYYLNILIDAEVSDPVAHIAIGTDFDGMGTESVIPGADNIVDFAEGMYGELKRRNLSEADIARIFSGNAIRVFEAGLPQE